MMEEQGRNILADLLKKALRFFGRCTLNISKKAGHKAINNFKETGHKSVKSLVKMGRDLELSEEIKSKDHLKEICHKCKKQGLAFAIQKTDDGYRILYQRKDSAVLSSIVRNIIGKELKTKRSIKEVFNSVSKIKQKRTNISRKTPVKHREVSAR